ncbi:hypothetical protein CCP3SC1AL1_570001 [Gammaproteobacteria bacterium]
MSLEAKKISILKSEIPVGIHILTISDLKLHKKSNGEIITFEGNPAVIVSFKNNGLIHQELYWIGSTNYTKLQKVIVQVGLDPNNQINKKDIVGKQIQGIITEIKTMRGAEEIKSEKKLSDTFTLAEKVKQQQFTEYKQEGF